MKIKCSLFVKRQIPGSSFSYSEIYSFEEIEEMTTTSYIDGKITPGYRDGVVLVSIPPNGFVSGIVSLTGAMKINSRFESRQLNEQAYLQTSAVGERLKSAQVDIVLYRKDVLAEDNDVSCEDADFEIISINAAPLGGAPMHPYVMARNQLHLKGGTQGYYTSEQWAESVKFWSEHAQAAPSPLGISKRFSLFIKRLFRKRVK